MTVVPRNEHARLYKRLHENAAAFVLNLHPSLGRGAVA